VNGTALLGQEHMMTTNRYVVLVGLLLAAPLSACGGAAAESSSSDSPPAPGGLVGKPAPDFSVGAVANGKGKVALSDLRGKVVLVDFWGTFCEPCKKSFPKLQDLHTKYATSGLKIVGISEDEGEDKGSIPGFANTYGAKFTLGWDEDKSIARSYKPPTMPSSFLIDKTGVIRYAHVGYHDGEEVEVEKEIKELLAR
jgi:peroxiredoxin